MFWQPKDIYEYAVPTLALWKFSGLPAYKTQKKKIFHQTSIVLIGAATFITSYMYVFLNYFDFDHSLRDYACLYEFVVITVQNVGFVCTGYLKKNKIPHLVSKISSTEEQISRIFQKKFDYTDTAKDFIVTVIVKWCLLMAVFVFDFMFMVQETKDLVFRYVIYGGWMYYFILDMTIFFFLTSVIKLNREFYNSLQYKHTKNDVSCDLQEIINIQRMLQKLATDVVDELQYFLFLKLLTDFFFAASDLVYGIKSTIIATDGLISGLAMTIVVSVWLLLIVHSVVTTTSFFDEMTEQEFQTGELIEDISKQLPNIYKIDEIIFLRMKINRFRFTMFGLFPLNRTVVYSMTAGVTTYIIYLIQFNRVD